MVFIRHRLYIYSWWKPQCWLNAPYISAGYLRYRHNSGRCRSLLFFLSNFEARCCTQTSDNLTCHPGLHGWKVIALILKRSSLANYKNCLDFFTCKHTTIDNEIQVHAPVRNRRMLQGNLSSWIHYNLQLMNDWDPYSFPDSSTNFFSVSKKWSL